MTRPIVTLALLLLALPASFAQLPTNPPPTVPVAGNVKLEFQDSGHLDVLLIHESSGALYLSQRCPDNAVPAVQTYAVTSIPGAHTHTSPQCQAGMTVLDEFDPAGSAHGRYYVLAQASGRQDWNRPVFDVIVGGVRVPMRSAPPHPHDPDVPRQIFDEPPPGWESIAEAIERHNEGEEYAYTFSIPLDPIPRDLGVDGLVAVLQEKLGGIVIEDPNLGALLEPVNALQRQLDDLDGDGYGNEKELEGGSNPLRPESTPISDDDGDGCINGEEKPLHPAAPWTKGLQSGAYGVVAAPHEDPCGGYPTPPGTGGGYVAVGEGTPKPVWIWDPLCGPGMQGNYPQCQETSNNRDPCEPEPTPNCPGYDECPETEEPGDSCPCPSNPDAEPGDCVGRDCPEDPERDPREGCPEGTCPEDPSWNSTEPCPGDPGPEDPCRDDPTRTPNDPCYDGYGYRRYENGNVLAPITIPAFQPCPGKPVGSDADGDGFARLVVCEATVTFHPTGATSTTYGEEVSFGDPNDNDPQAPLATEGVVDQVRDALVAAENIQRDLDAVLAEQGAAVAQNARIAEAFVENATEQVLLLSTSLANETMEAFQDLQDLRDQIQGDLAAVLEAAQTAATEGLGDAGAAASCVAQANQDYAAQVEDAAGAFATNPSQGNRDWLLYLATTRTQLQAAYVAACTQGIDDNGVIQQATRPVFQATSNAIREAGEAVAGQVAFAGDTGTRLAFAFGGALVATIDNATLVAHAVLDRAQAELQHGVAVAEHALATLAEFPLDEYVEKYVFLLQSIDDQVARGLREQDQATTSSPPKDNSGAGVGRVIRSPVTIGAGAALAVIWVLQRRVTG